jgi:hypothetical protein
MYDISEAPFLCAEQLAASLLDSAVIHVTEIIQGSGLLAAMTSAG